METKFRALLTNLRFDLPASLVVALVALPLCMGIAVASGAPPFAGLTAGIVGGIVVGLLSKSSVSVSGPAAGLTVIVFTALETLPFDAFLAAVCLGGVFQLVFSVVKAGVIGDFIPASVIRGMLAAIGCLLIIKQIPHAFGLLTTFSDESGFLHVFFGEGAAGDVSERISQHFAPGAMLVSAICLPFLFFWDAVNSRLPGVLRYIPGPLLVVIFGVLINGVFHGIGGGWYLADKLLVNVPVANNFSEFKQNFTVPDFSILFSSLSVWGVGLTLALVASVETLLCIEAADRLDPRKRITPTNRELAAQGVGNIISGLLGGLPVTSVIVRTSANVLSGARTKMSAVFHGVILLACVGLAPSMLNKVPLAALAAVLISVGYKLVKPSVFVDEYKRGPSHIISFVVTIGAILVTDLLSGIFIGFLCSVAFMGAQNFRSTIVLMSDGNNYLLRCRKDLYFIHKHTLKGALQRIPDNAVLIIDVTRAGFIDRDNIDMIKQFMTDAPSREIKVNLRGSIRIFDEALQDVEEKDELIDRADYAAV